MQAMEMPQQATGAICAISDSSLCIEPGPLPPDMASTGDILKSWHSECTSGFSCLGVKGDNVALRGTRGHVEGGRLL